VARDIDPMMSKQIEIEQVARAALQRAGGGPLKFVDAVVSNFVELTGPSRDRAARDKGQPGKPGNPGNLCLSWRKLMPALPAIVVEVAEANSAHVWLVVYIALAIWSKLSVSAAERIEIDDATTMLALWRYRNADDEISEDDGLSRTNAVRAEVRLPPLAKPGYAAVIDRLVRLRCLSVATGVIRLRGSAAVIYE
jgi:hypothetical protein